MRSLCDEISNGGLRNEYDAVVIGAGPGGCAAAAALSARGARALVVEANPQASRRFAGEWIHPPGVRVLRRLGLLDGLDSGVPSRGFAVLPNDGLGLIELDYPDGDGLCCEHETLVRHLRTRVSQLPGTQYIEGARARVAGAGVVELSSRGKDAAHVRAERIIVAAGRSHRRDGSPSANHASISQMAGLIVRGTLPFEGYGHVILGGPGPALAYRIDDKRIRLCLDAPSSIRRGAKAAAWIWKSFSELLPHSLRAGFRESLVNDQVAWAANSFRPRDYDESSVCLVGDAAGFFHPLTAMGITMSVLDAESAARGDALERHAERRGRETHVPELLSNAIYQAFVRDDPASLVIRASILRSWRSSAAQRTRTMNLLAASTTSRAEFVRSFGEVAFGAAMEAAFRDPGALPGLVGWLRWPWASLGGHRTEVRSRSVSWAAPASWGAHGGFGAPAGSKEGQHAI